MFSKNKLTKSFLAIAFCLSLTANAHAAENKIFIKLHDIKPIKTGDLVTSCELKTTMYNNTDIKISSVDIALRWEDKYLVKNRLKTKNVRSIINIGELNPASQITKKIVIDTAKCFLLTEKPKFNVKNCKTLDRKDSSRCSTIFSFVTPMDDAYYAEFKEIVEGKNDDSKKINAEVDRKIVGIKKLIDSVVVTNKDTIEVLKIKED